MNPDHIANPQYRYVLRRSHQHDDSHNGTVVWVMLNPSTADDLTDDPTIRKVMHLSWAHGYSDLMVVNLFAARSTKPKHLVEMGPKAIGPDNDDYIRKQFNEADAVVFAWGASVPKPDWARRRLMAVHTFASQARARRLTPILCCGTNQDGSPKHPCYLANDTKLVPW